MKSRPVNDRPRPSVSGLDSISQAACTRLTDLVGLALVLALLTGVATAQTVIVSVSSPYMKGDRVVVSRAGDPCDSVALSSGGRYVAFATESNLDPDSVAKGNGRVTRQVYVHDRDLDGNKIFDEEGIGKTNTVIASVSTPDAQGKVERGNSSSGFFGVAISASGRYVAFESAATNLANPKTTKGLRHIYVHDRDADGNGIFDEPGPGKTRTFLIDVDKNGNEGNGSSMHPSIDFVGSKIAFESTATNLTNNKFDDIRDVFLRDWQGSRTFLLSPLVKQGDERRPSLNPAVSYDGRMVAFESSEKNLVDPPTNGKKQIFLVEVLTQKVIAIVSSSPKGDLGDNNSFSAALDGFGFNVAFMSDAKNLFDGALANRYTQTYRAGFPLPKLKLVIGLVSAGTEKEAAGNGDSAPGAVRISGNNESFRGVSMSNEANRVAFASAATNLIVGDTNGKVDVFVRDARKNKTIRASVSSQGDQGDNHSGYAGGTVISRDGRWVAFTSTATNLVDPGTDGTKEVYVRGLDKDFAQDTD